MDAQADSEGPATHAPHVLSLLLVVAIPLLAASAMYYMDGTYCRSTVVTISRSIDDHDDSIQEALERLMVGFEVTHPMKGCQQDSAFIRS